MRKLLTLSLPLLVLCWRPLPAQVSAGLSGTVTDPSGGAVPAAQVTARNTGTGLVRETVSGADGVYRILALPVGEYEVRAAKPQFSETLRTGIHLVVGQEATVDLRLALAAGAERVEVRADAALVNVSTQDITGLVDERQIRDLPLNGRSYDELLWLNPGW